MNIFEKGTKAKFRFVTSKGHLSIEDLWDLSLESLDAIAKSVNKQIKLADEESFIGKKASTTSELEDRLEILKSIIANKLEEKERKAKLAEKRAKLDQLEALYHSKSVEELNGKSREEIAAMIQELKES